jgi:hypothetical protein
MMRFITVFLFVVWAWAVGRHSPHDNMLELLAALIVALSLMRVLSGNRGFSR